jgi:exodeoxyribonuclease V gamma subunit
MAEQGRRTERDLVETLIPMLQRWQEVQALYPHASSKEPLRFKHDAMVLDDWLEGLRAAQGQGQGQGQGEVHLRVWLELDPGKLCADSRGTVVRRDKLITAWVRTIAASACGIPVQGVIVGRDATVTVNPLPANQAVTALTTLMDVWREGLSAPLPLPSRTALALVDGVKDVAGVYEGSRFLRGGSRGEGEEACLSRMYPDYEALCADGRFPALAERVFGPVVEWIKAHVMVEQHRAIDLAPSLPTTAASTDAQREVSTHE